MKSSLPKKALLRFPWCVLMITAGGCCIHIACFGPQAKYKRTVRVSAPLRANGLFSAETHNGSISIAGADVTSCNLAAEITGRAGSEREAQRLAEETTVTLEPSANRLTVKIRRPRMAPGQSVCVSLDGTIPKQTDLELETHNGAIEVSNIVGRVNAITNNGNVTASGVYGTCNLRSHNGSINCREVSGNAELITHNGNVCASYSQAAAPICNASITTCNGSIDFTAPRGLSAAVEASTHNGSIETELPLTVVGKVGPRKLEGTVGAGRGKLCLKTYNGSIKIRNGAK